MSDDNLNEAELEDLRFAMHLLEHPSFAAKLADLVGTPIEKGLELLPAKWNDQVQSATSKALLRALDVAMATFGRRSYGVSADLAHKIAVATAGGVGGFFGIPALTLELPLSTTVMLRSIADIAQSEGERLEDLETKLACLSVFALGGSAAADDSTETGYFAVRAALSRATTEATQHLATRGLSREGAPAILRFVGQIAARFGVNVTEKAAAQAIPVIGALGGATLNVLFMDHFQGMARGQFIIRRLSRSYGEEAVQRLYEQLRADAQRSAALGDHGVDESGRPGR